jgi:hypothetical protein
MRGAVAVAFSACLVAMSATSNQAQSAADTALIAQKALCAEAGSRARAQFRKDWFGETFPGEAIYSYNAHLKTCLYADSYSDVDATLGALLGYKQRQIVAVIDALSGAVLLEWTAYDGRALKTSVSKADFVKRYYDLMQQTPHFWPWMSETANDQK